MGSSGGNIENDNHHFCPFLTSREVGLGIVGKINRFIMDYYQCLYAHLPVSDIWVITPKFW